MLEEKQEKNAEWYAEQRQQLEMQLKTVTRELSERTILLGESKHLNRSKGWNNKSLAQGTSFDEDELDIMQKEIDKLK